MTITRVTMKPGAVSARHSHPNSEQTWLIEAGQGMLLLEGDQSIPLSAGEIVRTPPCVVHGIENTGEGALVYLAITTPPEDMGKYYEG
ncbi:cupin domain-containing protein [Rhizobium sp. K7/93]|nr:cupin domain-containing protein [Rhizobium sp. B209b/85]MBO9172446.1 cupin domain-containing protein [Rhizobium sp. L245/93]MBO9186515.1 cupin domain-containing protein [Rhizobium sp. E27B/91]QXZ86097.1 cupin domain-containing protein [Rhizobium sp. K1/93]QXZ92447.1 cupin domain-containing protein [Rhizobium sp. K15/93]QXZ98703.1 cupin domain-containing protein [Rhizobium sp. B230/85]QYA04332.1 cupin domain-containing protein [Rhizobium sp. B21/90]